MLVKDSMTLNPITADENMPVLNAYELMKRKNVRKLPVMRNNELIGIVTDRDIRSAGPSQVFSFDNRERILFPELYEFLTKIRISDIMSRNLFVISPEKTIITAAMIMVEKGISGLPVVDNQKKLLGILTKSDIFKTFLKISAVYEGRTVFGLRIEDQPGSIKKVADVMRDHGGRIASIMSYVAKINDKTYRHVYIRIMNESPVDMEALKTELEQKYDVLFITEDVTV